MTIFIKLPLHSPIKAWFNTNTEYTLHKFKHDTLADNVLQQRYLLVSYEQAYVYHCKIRLWDFQANAQGMFNVTFKRVNNSNYSIDHTVADSIIVLYIVVGALFNSNWWRAKHSYLAMHVSRYSTMTLIVFRVNISLFN